MSRRTEAVVLGVLLGATGNAAAAIDFTAFHTPAQVDAELANLAAAHASIARLTTIGSSANGSPIRALKISDGVAADDASEGDVVFVALHHAREWITVEMGLYLAEYLLTHYDTDPALRACMDNLEIWILPVVNPDGYVYSAAAPGNRYWRKNRQANGDGTFGTDLNRNYAFQWGLGGGGSEGSPNTFDDTYWGSAPFSAPETATLRDFVNGLQNPRALVTYHSFSELFLRPWAHSNLDPPGEPTLAFLAQDSIARMAAVHGHTYAENISYNSFGETTDFFWNDRRLAGFTPEMRPSPLTSGCGRGLCGFSPDPSEILPAVEENLAAALQLIRDAGCRRLWIKDHGADTGAEPSAVWLGDHWSQAFWVSPDIWTVPATLEEGATVTLHVRVHNDGPAASGATVRAYYTDPRVSLEFPNPGAVLIGERTGALPAGDSEITFSWVVPTGTNIWGEHHWCVGAVVTHPDDRPLTTLIERTSNIGGRNFQTVEATSAVALNVAVTNFLEVAAEYVVAVDPDSLPAGWRAIVPRVPPPRALDRKARILGIQGNVLAPGETVVQPVRLVVPDGVPEGTVREIHVSGALLPLVPGRRTPVGNGYTFRVRVCRKVCVP